MAIEIACSSKTHDIPETHGNPDFQQFQTRNNLQITVEPPANSLHDPHLDETTALLVNAAVQRITLVRIITATIPSVALRQKCLKST